MERTENDFVFGYSAVTLDRWYCGHGHFQNCPESQKLAFLLALIAARFLARY
jgi:hypothetical protein